MAARADHRREAPVLQTPAQVGQPDSVRLDHEEDRLAVHRLSRGSTGDRTILAAGSQTPRDRSKTSPPITSKHIDLADVLEAVPLHVDESIRPEPEHDVAIAGAAGADDPGAPLPSELHGDGADAAACAVDEHRLAGLEAPVLEQPLPDVRPEMGSAAA